MNLIIFVVVATVLAINANAATVFFNVNQVRSTVVIVVASFLSIIFFCNKTFNLIFLQGVSGVTGKDFKDNKASFTETVQLAVAETLSGVTTSATVTGVNFVNQIVAGAGGDDGDDNGGGDDVGRRLSSTLTMQYIVQILDTTDAITVFTNVLQTAANDGTFENNLHNAATTTGANQMSNIAVDTNSFQSSNMMTKRGDSKRLTGTQITGLIIGVFMFLGVLGTLIAFIMSCSASTAAPAAADKSLEMA